jgi:hypothetical protein
MTKVDATTVRPHRLLHWAAIVGCAAAAAAVGLLTDETFLFAAAKPEAAAHVTLSEPVATPEPAYLAIVPSPSLTPIPNFSSAPATVVMDIMPNNQISPKGLIESRIVERQKTDAFKLP